MELSLERIKQLYEAARYAKSHGSGHVTLPADELLALLPAEPVDVTPAPTEPSIAQNETPRVLAEAVPVLAQTAETVAVPRHAEFGISPAAALELHKEGVQAHAEVLAEPAPVAAEPNAFEHTGATIEAIERTEAFAAELATESNENADPTGIPAKDGDPALPIQ